MRVHISRDVLGVCMGRNIPKNSEGLDFKKYRLPPWEKFCSFLEASIFGDRPCVCGKFGYLSFDIFNLPAVW